jgi:hypothetical protein
MGDWFDSCADAFDLPGRRVNRAAGKDAVRRLAVVSAESRQLSVPRTARGAINTATRLPMICCVKSTGARTNEAVLT